MTILLAKLSPMLLVPWVVFSIGADNLGQQQLPITTLIAGMSIMGTLLKKQALLGVAYAALLLVLIWGKASADLLGRPGPDTALLLLQFVLVLFLYEVASAGIIFESNYQTVKERNDEFSTSAKHQMLGWYTRQVQALGKMTTAASGLSLGLVVVGAAFSIGFTQLAFAAVLVMGSVIVLLFTLINRREPDGNAK